MESIKNHSSRRKPVEVWEVFFSTDNHEESRTLFWYKKDAEKYIIDHANECYADEFVDDDDYEANFKPFKSINKALEYLNDSYSTWDLSTVTINS